MTNFQDKANFIWQVADNILLEFVHTKLDLYMKLKQPNVNRTLKDMWYSEYQRGPQVPDPTSQL